MAARFAVGTGNWTASNTAIWSATSNGATGASVPTSSDDVTLDSHSGTITITAAANCANFTQSGGTLAGSSALTVASSFTRTAGTWSHTGTVTFSATSTGKTITSAGAQFGGNVTLNGVGGGWTEGDALSAVGTVTLTNGAFSDGGFTLTCAAFSSSNSNTRSITKAAQWTITGTGTVVSLATVTGLSLSASGGWNLTNSSSAARTFASGGLTYSGALSVSAGTGTFTFGGVGTVGGMDFTGFAGSWAGNGIGCTGDLVLGASMSIPDANVAITMSGSGTQKIASNGVSLNRVLAINSSATVQLQDAFPSSTRVINLNAGTFDVNGKAITVPSFNAVTASCQVINASGAVLTLTGTINALNVSPSLCTINYADVWGQIVLTDTTAATKSINTRFGESGGYHYRTITLSAGAGGAQYVINGSDQIDSLVVQCSAPCTVSFRGGLEKKIGQLTVPSASGSEVTLNSADPATQAILTYTGAGVLSTDYVNAQDILAGPGYSWFLGSHSTNLGNNLGVAFCTPANAGMMELAA